MRKKHETRDGCSTFIFISISRFAVNCWPGIISCIRKYYLRSRQRRWQRVRRHRQAVLSWLHLATPNVEMAWAHVQVQVYTLFAAPADIALYLHYKSAAATASATAAPVCIGIDAWIKLFQLTDLQVGLDEFLFFIVRDSFSFIARRSLWWSTQSSGTYLCRLAAHLIRTIFCGKIIQRPTCLTGVTHFYYTTCNL